MSEQPPQLPLDRHLAQQAEQTVPDDLDLWPGVQRRLRDRSSATFSANGGADPREIDLHSAARYPLPPARQRWRQAGGLISAVVSVAFVAVTIAFFVIVAGRPGEVAAPPPNRNGATGQLVPPGATAPTPAAQHRNGEGPIPDRTPGRDSAAGAESEPIRVAGPACTFDIDVSVEAEPDSIVIAVHARANWACGDAGTLRLAIVDASGERSVIAGNPLILPLQPDGRERRADSAVAWTNWCGEPERFRIETTFGDERDSHSLGAPPRCVDAAKPSTLRMTPADAPFATPATTTRLATPSP